MNTSGRIEDLKAVLALQKQLRERLVASSWLKEDVGIVANQITQCEEMIAATERELAKLETP